MSKYLTFVSPFKSPLAENIGLLVRSKKHGTILGSIQYYSSWKQFCFSPSRGTVWSWDCLADIEAELKRLNKTPQKGEKDEL